MADLRVYVGQGNSGPRSNKLIEAREAGIGLCLCPGELPPLFGPWFLDNGAFRAFRAGVAFNVPAFEQAIEQARRCFSSPDFTVVPDVVGGGLASLSLSLSWVERLADLRPYLAVQDGMATRNVEPVIGLFSGVFVGGSVPWKLNTGVEWVSLAHAHGKLCHVGRVGTPERIAWAREIKVDSVDSSQPLWTDEKWKAFLSELRDPAERSQRRLFQ